MDQTDQNPHFTRWSNGLSNFPVDDLLVGASVCPVHCEKTVDRIRMLFGIIGRTVPGMRQVVRFRDQFMGRGTFGAKLGCAIVTNRDFMAYMCVATWPPN